MNDGVWLKSSYSRGGDANCLETYWRRSSCSQGGATNCLECRTDHDRVLLRDTRHRHLGHLDLSVAEWRAFIEAAKHDVL
jgi:hypothetical protein